MVLIFILGIMLIAGLAVAVYRPGTKEKPGPVPPSPPKEAPKPAPEKKPEPEKPKPPAEQPKPPAEPDFTFPAAYRPVHKQLEPFFNEVAAYFSREDALVAIYPFTLSGGGEGKLPAYLDESASYYLSRNKRITLVQRSADSSASGAKYVVSGRAIPIGGQVRLAVRITDPFTAEILDSFDHYLEIDSVLKPML